MFLKIKDWILEYVYVLKRTYIFYKQFRELSLNPAVKDYIVADRMNEFIELVSELSGIDRDTIMNKTKSRKRIYAVPRMVLMVVFHYSLNIPQLRVETLFQKGHPAVIYSKDTINNLISTNREFRETYGKVFIKALNFNPRFGSSIEMKKLL